MTDFSAAIAAAREALALLREHDGGTRYEGDDDDVGTRACCGVASYKPHDSDCPHAVAVAEFARLLAALDAAQPVAWMSHSALTGQPVFDINPPDESSLAGEIPLFAAPQAPPAAVANVTPRDGKWVYGDNEENFVGEECDTELDAIAAALDNYGDDLETVYLGQTKRIDKARLVRGDHIIELIEEAAGEEVGEAAYGWPRLSDDECDELERIVIGYVLSKSPANFTAFHNFRQYTREQAEALLAVAAWDAWDARAAARKGE